MAVNFPGPYELRFFYTAGHDLLGGPIQHVQRLNCDLTSEAFPGDQFIAKNLRTRGGVATPALDVAFNDYLALLAPFFRNTVTFDTVELWKYTAGTFQAVFISALSSFTTSGGSSLQTSTPEVSQLMLTFRTQEGGTMKISLMENQIVPGVSVPMASAGANVLALAGFITGSTNWILARDTSYPIASMRSHPGRNEALFKKRFRP